MTNHENLLIVFDTNVWLDLYKLPPTLILPLTQSLDGVRDLLWLPTKGTVKYFSQIKLGRMVI